MELLSSLTQPTGNTLFLTHTPQGLMGKSLLIKSRGYACRELLAIISTHYQQRLEMSNKKHGKCGAKSLTS